MNEVTVLRLSDKKLSVRLDDKEIVLLPERKKCTSDVLEEAFQQIVDAVAATADDDEW